VKATLVVSYIQETNMKSVQNSVKGKLLCIIFFHFALLSTHPIGSIKVWKYETLWLYNNLVQRFKLLFMCMT